MPAACPLATALIFYVTTDTSPVHFWWCMAGLPAPVWRRLLMDVLPAAPVKTAGPVGIGMVQPDGSCSPNLPTFAPSFTTPPLKPGDVGAAMIQKVWVPCRLP